MGQLLRDSRAVTLVWVGLIAVTLASWWLGIEEGGEPGDGASAAAVAVIVIAFVKVRFVGRHFMELRGAPLLARVLLDAYVLVVGTALTIIYLATS